MNCLLCRHSLSDHHIDTDPDAMGGCDICNCKFIGIDATQPESAKIYVRNLYLGELIETSNAKYRITKTCPPARAELTLLKGDMPSLHTALTIDNTLWEVVMIGDTIVIDPV